MIVVNVFKYTVLTSSNKKKSFFFARFLTILLITVHLFFFHCVAFASLFNSVINIAILQYESYASTTIIFISIKFNWSTGGSKRKEMNGDRRKSVTLNSVNQNLIKVIDTVLRGECFSTKNHWTTNKRKHHIDNANFTVYWMPKYQWKKMFFHLKHTRRRSHSNAKLKENVYWISFFFVNGQ